MKLKVTIVLLTALAIELVNWFLLAFPIDVGYPPDTPWYIQLIGIQWVALHGLGLFSLVWFENVAGCHQFNVVMGCRASGYDRTLRRWLSNYSPADICVYIWLSRSASPRP